MKEILDNYVETSFDGAAQATPKFKQFDVNYKPYFPENKEAKVLDIGIGRGEMLSSMKRWGYTNYKGVDISPSTVTFCTSLGLNAELVEDTQAWLREHANTFEVITLLDVLEHIPRKNVIAFVKDLRTALKPGGTLIIQVPNLQAPDGQLHRYNDFTHESGFIENSLQQVLLAGGFSEFHFKGFEILVRGRLIDHVAKVFRAMYWFKTKIVRKLNTNLSPNILNPVFFAAVTKKK